MKTRSQFLPTTLLSMLASTLLLSAANAYADDTEIFFGGAAVGSQVKPNVLFVLDNSGSMAWRTYDSNNPQGTEQSRMNILKKSFSDLINNARNINAGIMVLNSRSEYANSRMAYPITDIDASLSSSTATASKPEILESGDDASQTGAAGNNAVIDEPTLAMGYFTSQNSALTPITLQDDDAFNLRTFTPKNGTAGDYACNLLPYSRSKNEACRPYDDEDRRTLTLNTVPAMLLFRTLNIPAAATITSANLTLMPVSNSVNYETRMYVQAELNKTPLPLNDNSLISRNFTTTSSQVVPANWNVNQAVTLNVMPELQAIQSITPTADAIQSALFKVLVNRDEHSSDRTICMRASNLCPQASLPTLAISYTVPSSGTVEKSVALRFQNVGIPQGATITSARIDMVPIATGSDPLTMQIRAEATGDATVFSNGTNLGARTKTTAVTSWAVPEWIQSNPPAHENGPDVTNLVQEVVSSGSWCGNNAMAFHLTPAGGSGSRTAMSFDGSPGLQPSLTVQYSGGTGGCLNPIVDLRISQAKNDAWENDNNSKTVTLGGSNLPLDRQLVGARYENLGIINGAQVIDARVFLTPDSTVVTPSLSVDLNLENSANSTQFTSNSGNLSNRSKTTARGCTINDAGGGWTKGKPYTCAPSSLKTDLQSIFAKASWAPGNAISLFITPANDSTLDATSYESVPAESITLRIKLNNGSLTNVTRTVRNELDAIVQAMTASSGTPVVPTLDEAATYYRGERSGTTDPMTSACQPNHLVLLTDGQANSNTSGAKSSIAALAGACDASYDDGEICGRELTKFIYENDLSSSLEGEQNITVHTIGFALDASSNSDDIKQFLSDLASPKTPDSADKSTYTAEDSQGLNDAFNRIIQSVMSVDTTFVAPGVTVNQFSRKESKNELYYALFRPKATQAWPGNLKRYGLNDSGVIVDWDAMPAVNNTGSFFDNARSFWSATDDGNQTEQGGAASHLDNHSTRNLKTWIGSTVPAGGSSLQNLDASLVSNAALAPELAIALNEVDPLVQASLINWIRGSADGTANGTVQRKAMGDPLHSEPALALYACTTYTDNTYTSCATEDQTVFVSGNEGMLQAIDTSDGSEHFSFMPQALLENIKTLKDNAEITSGIPKVYGLDSSVALWVNDANRNGVIYGGKDPDSATPALLSGLNTGEHIYAYVTMGRGGRDIYALNVTDRSNPTLLWQIKGGSAGFENLGQTWSVPVPTKIKVSNGSTVTTRDVLIFAGGYDPAQDAATALTADSMGNALYIVDAITGVKIWSASNEDSPTKTLSNMQYGMPASPRVIDFNGDDLADQIFIGDMGGQLWRFYINNGSTAANLVSQVDSNGNGTLESTDGVFATIGGSGEAGLRRFYNSPDAALTRHDGKIQLAVSIGSGHRGHPLSVATSDRFYSFRTPQVYNPNGAAAHTAIVEANLYDATANTIQTGTVSEKAAELASLNAAKGWMIRLGSATSGEKALAESLTYAGITFFTTYAPGDVSASPCQAVPGEGRVYAVNLTDATAYSTTNDPAASRSRVTATVGIPPRPVIVHLKDKSTVCIGTDCNSPAPKLDTTPIPTYWIDK